ncbi:MAG: LPXTG cell wall anchor domain-containing protein [Actinomycetota bacterium]|nr:LPXTG cell wall anchor domain-containing protein [Actinomycetota bacterium]
MTRPKPATKRRFPALVVAGSSILLVALASPAEGQVRDPFDPVVDTSAQTTTDTGALTSSTDPAATTETTTTATTETTTDEGTLPNTGGSVSTWLAIAYVLVAAGAGLLLFAKTIGESSGHTRTPRRHGDSTP